VEHVHAGDVDTGDEGLGVAGGGARVLEGRVMKWELKRESKVSMIPLRNEILDFFALQNDFAGQSMASL
jgi:hypothetical protein